MAVDEQYAQALRDVNRLEQQVRDLKAAFLPFVHCNFTYFSGKVLGSDAKLTREQVERARTLIACPTHGTTSTPGCRACRELIDAEVAAEVASGVDVPLAPSTTSSMQFDLLDAARALENAAHYVTPELAALYKQRAAKVYDVISALARGVNPSDGGER